MVKRMRWYLVALLLLGLLCVWGIYRALGIAADILVVAFVFAYLMHPLVVFLEKRGISRRFAVLATITVSTIALAILILGVAPFIYRELKSLVLSLPDIFHALLERVNVLLERIDPDLRMVETDLIETFKSKIQENAENLFKPVMTATTAVLSSSLAAILFVAQLALFPLFFYYMIQHFEHIQRTLLNLVPQNYQESCRYYLRRFNTVLSAFIRGQLIDCLVLAVIYSFGLWISGVKFGFLIGLLAGFLTIIPYVGAWVGAIGAILLSLVYQAEFAQYLGIAITFAIAQSVEGFIIQPLVIGNKVGLAPLTTILLVIAGGNIGGFVGLLIAIPLGGMAQIVILDLLTYYRKSRVYRGT